MKTLQYPLKALTLSQEECDGIMKPILQAGLSNSSIYRNYPRDVAFGSIDEGGLGIEDMHIHQGAERIAFITEHLQEDTLSAELLKTSIELGKVEKAWDVIYFNLITTCTTHFESKMFRSSRKNRKS